MNVKKVARVRNGPFLDEEEAEAWPRVLRSDPPSTSEFRASFAFPFSSFRGSTPSTLSDSLLRFAFTLSWRCSWRRSASKANLFSRASRARLFRSEATGVTHSDVDAIRVQAAEVVVGTVTRKYGRIGFGD